MASMATLMANMLMLLVQHMGRLLFCKLESFHPIFDTRNAPLRCAVRCRGEVG